MGQGPEDKNTDLTVAMGDFLLQSTCYDLAPDERGEHLI